jgi:PKD repeat protein
MKDHEGSTYVPSDNSLWLADDNANAIYEINPATGALKRTINRSAFNSAPRLGGGPQAGVNRTDDFESMAYDPINEQLYLFSGPCCTGSILPTAFRLTRNSNGVFRVESYQPLASGANYTASAWNPADGMIYVGVGNQLRTYNYEANTAGSTFQVPGLSGILGMGFSSTSADLFVVTSAESLKRVAWATKTLVPGWSFDLTPFDVRDSRGVELIGDQIYVSDGADSRPAGPLKYAVFVFNVSGSTPVAPVASFNANPMSGDAPLSVTFTDTSTGPPNSWDWDFGDSTAHSSVQNPTHTYTSPGSYPVTLTVNNSIGPASSAQKTIEVTTPPPSQEFVGNPGFETNTTGWGVTGSGTGVALTHVTTPTHTGGGAALLRNNSTGTRRCVLNDVPNWVSTTQAGLYTGSIWVQGGTAGKKIKITLKEINGGSVVGSRVVTYTLNTSWQRLAVTYTPVAAGTSTLDFQVFMPLDQVPPGVCFYADDASILKS